MDGQPFKKFTATLLVAESLFNKSLNNLKWAGSQQLISQFIRTIFTILLARILSPTEFGIVGLATVIYYFLLIVSRFGIADGLIQAKNLDEEKFAALFKLNISIALAAGLLFFMAAPWIADYYNQVDLKNVIRLLSLNFLFNAIIVAPRARFEKDLRFNIIAKMALPAVALASFLAVLAATAGWGVYSLVVLYLSENFILALGYIRFRPKAKAAPFSEIRSILSFSWKMALSGTIGYIGKNIDTLIIAKWIGPVDLGLYNFSYRLTRLPTQNFAAILDRVLFPIYSTIQTDLVRLSNAYHRALQCVSRIIIPSMAVAIVVLPPIVDLLLGDQWKVAIPVMQIFCLLTIIQSIGRGNNAIIQALGRSDIVLSWVVFVTPANILTVYFTARHGIIAVALGLVIIRALILLLQQVVIANLLKTSPLKLFTKDVAGLIPAIGLGSLLYASIALIDQPLLEILTITSVLALLVGGALLVFGKKTIWNYFTGSTSTS
jgi:teichuronic acid exporter